MSVCWFSLVVYHYVGILKIKQNEPFVCGDVSHGITDPQHSDKTESTTFTDGILHMEVDSLILGHRFS
ncbi:hypothetical protein [Xenorhabdus beddingii]|nr:hypothetical protein [Xenorhabdus beddingii]